MLKNRSTVRKAAVLAAMLAGVCATLIAQSAVARLGVSENAAQDTVMSATTGGYGSYNVASKAFLALAPGARAMAVNEVVAWAKAYTNSAAFKQAWAKEREDVKPKPPAATGSVDDALNQQNANLQKQIDGMKKAAASMPPEQRKAVEAAIQQITAQQQAAAKDPNQQAVMRQALAGQRANDQTQYQAELKKWQEDFPADANLAIARRLKEFLAMSATVNFDAKTLRRGSETYFADDQFEHKPDEWKVCFRAGREATAAARAAATAWLKEIGQ